MRLSFITGEYHPFDSNSSYEPCLAVPDEDKRRLILCGRGMYLLTSFRGQEIILGEIFGGTPLQLKIFLGEEIPDLNPEDDETFYVYSTTIAPQYQGQGYGRLLVEVMNHHLKRFGHTKICGHTTSSAMSKIREKTGAVFTGVVHENWCESGRSARYYEQTL